ncbi:MAG TPA: SRPBCC family protein [Solirubrobacter sp.]|jgi:uncharacterized protein YndB with AHSA1/START domain|nr:SRPBCC family protein [Solirubrobacter sp.]
MKDGQLFERDGRFELRFERSLAHPVARVWSAITEPEGLSAWFPFAIEGERRAGAPLRFVFAEDELSDFTGEMVEFDPPSVMELRYEDDETLRLELRPSDTGCVLTLINRFDEIGKAARDAAGWHACLDLLETHLDGAPPIDSTARWQSVHPRYVETFGPEAATIGPPTM